MNDVAYETIVILVEMEVARKSLADILTTAFEGGINYWCDGYELVEAPSALPAEQYYLDYMAPAYGGYIMVFAIEDDEHYLLGIDKLRRGLTRAIREGRVGYVNTQDDEWVGDIDAGIADTIVQYALFDEQVYA